MLDIWHLVLTHLADDFGAATRLLAAVPALHQRVDAAFWRALEKTVLHRPMYHVFSRVHEHLGRKRRLTRWASFCAVPCAACGVSQASSTFSVGRKLCVRCRNSVMVSESTVAPPVKI